MVSVCLSAMIPPPIPLTPFLLAAGALGLSRPRFLTSYGLGRAIRYGVVAWLGFRYGRHELALWQKYLHAWTTPILTVYISLIVLGAVYGFWKYKNAKAKS
jgi:membrane protein DedA with SNARE-associated domain